MAFIDLLINETALKFELGNKSIAVISALVSTMNNREIGGIQGFLNRFRQAGLTNTVDSWVNGSLSLPLTPEEIKISLDDPLLQSLSEKTEVNNPLLSEILAFLIPPIICHLSSQKPSLKMRPDEMRKALWSVSTLPEAEISSPSFADGISVPTEITSKLVSTFSTSSSLKSLGNKLLRPFQF